MVRDHDDPLADLKGLLRSAQQELHYQEDAQAESFAQVMAACDTAKLEGVQLHKPSNVTASRVSLDHHPALLSKVDRQNCIVKAKDHEAWEKRRAEESSAILDVLDMVKASDALHFSIKASSTVLQKPHHQHQLLRGWKGYGSPSPPQEMFETAGDQFQPHANSMLLSVSQDEIETTPPGSVESSRRMAERSTNKAPNRTEKAEQVPTKTLTVVAHASVPSHLFGNFVNASKLPCENLMARQEAALLQVNQGITELREQMATKTRNIEALRDSIAAMDKHVMELTSIRKEEHQKSVDAASARAAASKVIEHAVARFKKCCTENGVAMQAIEAHDRREKNRSSLRHPETKLGTEDVRVSHSKIGPIPAIGATIIMLGQIKGDLETAASEAVKEEAHAVQEYAKAMSSSADHREAANAKLSQEINAQDAADELRRRQLELMSQRAQVQDHLQLLQRECNAARNINNGTMMDPDTLEMKIRKHIGDTSYYMIVILGLIIICMVLICGLVCVFWQLHRSSPRHRRPSSEVCETSRTQGSERTQLLGTWSGVHGVEYSHTVPVVDARPLSSDLPPTPSFLRTPPAGQGQASPPMGGILKKQTSPEKAQDSICMSDESSLWGAFSGHELTDEQIDMMVREAEAKQRQLELRQHLVEEGREQPRPWWKPEGGPRLSPQPSLGGEPFGSRQSSVPTLLAQGDDGTGSSSSHMAMAMPIQGSQEKMVRGVSMLQTPEVQSLGPSTSEQRTSGDRPHSLGVCTTPHTRPPRRSWGSDGATGGNVSLQSPDGVTIMREGRGQGTPQSAQHPVNTPGNWLWSPKSLSRSLPPLPGLPPPLPAQARTTPPLTPPSSTVTSTRTPPGVGTPTGVLTPPDDASVPGPPAAPPHAPGARSRSVGGSSTVSAVTQSGHEPMSSRSVMIDGHPNRSVVVQQYGTTPPPTPPSMIRGNNGQQVVVPPLWRNLTPPSSARLPDTSLHQTPLLRSPGQQR